MQTLLDTELENHLEHQRYEHSKDKSLETLEMAFPKTQSQRCVVHLVRTLYSLYPKKEAKQIIADFKKIYTSINIEEAYLMLDIFKNRHTEQKRIIKKVIYFMPYLEPLFELPQEIRKCIYSTNAVESVIQH